MFFFLIRIANENLERIYSHNSFGLVYSGFNFDSKYLPEKGFHIWAGLAECWRSIVAHAESSTRHIHLPVPASTSHPDWNDVSRRVAVAHGHALDFRSIREPSRDWNFHDRGAPARPGEFLKRERDPEWWDGGPGVVDAEDAERGDRRTRRRRSRGCGRQTGSCYAGSAYDLK